MHLYLEASKPSMPFAQAISIPLNQKASCLQFLTYSYPTYLLKLLYNHEPNQVLLIIEQGFTVTSLTNNFHLTFQRKKKFLIKNDPNKGFDAGKPLFRCI